MQKKRAQARVVKWVRYLLQKWDAVGDNPTGEKVLFLNPFKYMDEQPMTQGESHDNHASDATGELDTLVQKLIQRFVGARYGKIPPSKLVPPVLRMLHLSKGWKKNTLHSEAYLESCCENSYGPFSSNRLGAQPISVPGEDITDVQKNMYMYLHKNIHARSQLAYDELIALEYDSALQANVMCYSKTGGLHASQVVYPSSSLGEVSLEVRVSARTEVPCLAVCMDWRHRLLVIMEQVASCLRNDIDSYTPAGSDARSAWKIQWDEADAFCQSVGLHIMTLSADDKVTNGYLEWDRCSKAISMHLDSDPLALDHAYEYPDVLHNVKSISKACAEAARKGILSVCEDDYEDQCETCAEDNNTSPMRNCHSGPSVYPM